MHISYFTEDESSDRPLDLRLFGRLLSFLRTDLRLVSLALLLLIVSSLLTLAGPRLIGLLIDRGLVHQNWEQVVFHAGLYIAATLTAFGVSAVQSLIITWLGQKILMNLRTQVFAKLQYFPVSHFDRTPTGAIITRVTNDVQHLTDLFSGSLLVLLGDIVLIGGIFVYLILLDPALAAAVLSILPLFIASTLWFIRKVKPAYRSMRRKLALLNVKMGECSSGMREIASACAEPAVLKDYRELSEEARDSSVDTIRYFAIYNPLVTVFTGGTMALLLALGGGRVVSGELQVGEFVTFLIFAQMLFRPIRDFSERFNILQSSLASAERLFEYLESSDERDETVSKLAAPLVPSVEFDRVSFAYADGRPVLSDLSFTIRPGEKVGIVGMTGSGKTTVVSLLQRFYDHSHGTIRIGGIDIQTLARSDIRRHIGWVSQDQHLFSASIFDNIRLFDPAISEETVMSVLRSSGLIQLFQRFPSGIHSIVSERGTTLAKGERQLIAIARVLVTQAPIIVLDEATSSIDTPTEAMIQKAILKLIEARTALVIAHRLATIYEMDRLIVLSAGLVVESGTIDELMLRRGEFYRYHELLVRSVDLRASDESIHAHS